MSDNNADNNPNSKIFDANKELFERKRELKLLVEKYKAKIRGEEAYIEKLTSEPTVDDGIKKIIADSYARLFQLKDDLKIESQDLKDQIKEIKEVIKEAIKERN